MIDIAGDADFAAFRLALAGQDFDELPLAVAGHAGYADNLSATDCQRYVTDRDRAGIVERADLLELKPGLAYLAGARRLDSELLGADHGARHGIGSQVFHQAFSRELAAPEDGHLIAKGHYLAELVSDPHHG